MEKTTENYFLKADYEYGRLELYSVDKSMFYGYVVIDQKERMMHVCDLWIHEEFRGQTYGSILIRYVIDYATTEAVSCLYGHTALNDKQVHRFYRKSGFSVCEDKTYDVAWFTMQLGDSPGLSPDSEYLAKLCYLAKSSVNSLESYF